MDPHWIRPVLPFLSFWVRRNPKPVLEASVVRVIGNSGSKWHKRGPSSAKKSGLYKFKSLLMFKKPLKFVLRFHYRCLRSGLNVAIWFTSPKKLRKSVRLSGAVKSQIASNFDRSGFWINHISSKFHLFSVLKFQSSQSYSMTLILKWWDFFCAAKYVMQNYLTLV